MKKFFLPIAIATLALLPFQQSNAGKFGGFWVGYKFKLTVTKVSSIRLQGATQTKVPIPTGIPRYSKGDSIPFEILSKGAIGIRRVIVPFTSSSETSNLYMNTASSPRSDAVTIFKTPSGKATAGTVMYARYYGTGNDQSLNMVTYTLEKR